MCGGSLQQLGVLGNLEHLFCRDCGMMYYTEVTEVLKCEVCGEEFPESDEYFADIAYDQHECKEMEED